MAFSSRAVVPIASRSPWLLCLVLLTACKLGAAAPAATCPQPAPAPDAPKRDVVPAPAPDASAAPAECRAPFGSLLAELSQTQLVDMALLRDSLVVLIKEEGSPKTSLLRVRTDRAVAEPELMRWCSHGADRIAVDANYVYLPCLGSLTADANPKSIDPSRNLDGNISAIPLDGSELRRLEAKTRRPFWIGTDSSFVYWSAGSVLYRLPMPQPGLPLDKLPPERLTQRMASRDIFVGADGIYFQEFGGYIVRAAPSPRCVRLAETGTYADFSCSVGSFHLDFWKVPDLMKFLGMNARNEIFVQIQGQPDSLFRFVPESGALAPVAQVDMPVNGLLWLRDGSMLVRSTNKIWHVKVAGDAPADSKLWRHSPRGIVGWAADEHMLYLALKGSPLNPTTGFSLYALPLSCVSTAAPTRVESTGRPR